MATGKNRFTGRWRLRKMAGKRAPCRFRERELARVLRAGRTAAIPVQIHLARDGGLTISPAPLENAVIKPPCDEWEKQRGSSAPKIRP
jgi:hypothetical protein